MLPPALFVIFLRCMYSRLKLTQEWSWISDSPPSSSTSPALIPNGCYHVQEILWLEFKPRTTCLLLSATHTLLTELHSHPWGPLMIITTLTSVDAVGFSQYSANFVILIQSISIRNRNTSITHEKTEVNVLITAYKIIVKTSAAFVSFFQPQKLSPTTSHPGKD